MRRGDCLVHARALDEIQAEQLLLGLGERAVEHVGGGGADGLGVAGGHQSEARPERALGDQRVVHDLERAHELVVALLVERAGGGLVAVAEDGVEHGGLLASFTLGRTSIADPDINADLDTDLRPALRRAPPRGYPSRSRTRCESDRLRSPAAPCALRFASLAGSARGGPRLAVALFLSGVEKTETSPHSLKGRALDRRTARGGRGRPKRGPVLRGDPRGGTGARAGGESPRLTQPPGFAARWSNFPAGRGFPYSPPTPPWAGGGPPRGGNPPPPPTELPAPPGPPPPGGGGGAGAPTPSPGGGSAARATPP